VEIQNQPSQSSKYLTKSEFAQIQGQMKLDLHELQKKLNDDAQDDDDLGPGWKLTDDMIQKMTRSSWLRDELADSGLQQLIMKIVSSSTNIVNDNRRGYASSGQHFSRNFTTYREQLLSDIKLQYPQFQMFVGKLLYLAGVYERSDCTESNLNGTLDEWLSNVQHVKFSLKPLPQRVRPGSASLTNSYQCSGTDSESTSDDSEDDEALETDVESNSSDDIDSSTIP
jgi:hypothetical protein